MEYNNQPINPNSLFMTCKIVRGLTMKPKVKISQRQNNELNKVVRNFNARLSDLKKVEGILELPQKITKKELLNPLIVKMN